MSITANVRKATMRAVVRHRYGSPDVLELREVERPELTDDGVLVRVRAASVNPADWHDMTGTPLLARMRGGWRRPKTRQFGTDFAGTVEAVGKDVSGFEEGDEVYGARDGALAEYVCVKNAIAPKPANITFEEAAAVPIAALTALQGLRDKGQLEPAQKVLVNGASGGVGTFAVQIAKALVGEVTGVCSSRNVELVRSLGADQVVDYTQEDFTRGGERYDLLIDVAGGRSWSELKRVLADTGTYVMIGGPKVNRLVGISVRHLARIRFARGSRKTMFFIAKLNREDLGFMSELLESGQVLSVIDRQYELSETAQAMRYLGEGHAQGKIVVTI